jgi:tripartite-type tricarboxylate transporter receptor subunit TctC
MRPLVKLAVAVSFVVAPVLPVCAQDTRHFPVKPVRLVTSSAGSLTDVLARIIAAKFADKWGQPVVVENRTGAGGAIAAAIVAKAAPDGYTMLFQSSQFAVSAAIHEKLPYDAVRDFAGIAFIGNTTLVLVTSPAYGAKTVPEFIAFAKAQPKPILFSSASAGSAMYMNGERFRLTTGIPAQHIGFKGAPESVLEVAAVRVHYALPALNTALPMVRDNKLTPLAVIAKQRSQALPEVPMMTEIFPNYGRDGAFTLVAPAGTPRALIARIHTDLVHLFTLPDVKERLQKFEFDLAISKPEEFERLLKSDIETFRRVARQAGLIAK